MIAAPLVMPEVITGLSLLLLFVSLQELTGWPERERNRQKAESQRIID